MASASVFPAAVVDGPRVARRYRALLRVYPPSYRRRWGDEIIATLMETAGPGRRGPRAGDVADLVGSGVRQRLAQWAPGCAAGLALAAPFALALAGGISAYLWWRVEPTVHTGGFLGSWRTAAPVAYAGWLLAVVVTLIRPALGRVAVACAIGLTMAVPGFSLLTTVERPPLWVLSVLLGLGLVALTGRPSATTVDERLAVPAGMVAVATITVAVDRIWPVTGPTYYQPTIARVGVVLGLAAAVALVVAVGPALFVVRSVRLGIRPGLVGVAGRPVASGHGGRVGDHGRALSGERRSWLWAATLLAVLAGWLGPAGDAAGGPHFGRLAEVLLASCVAGVTLRGLAGTGTPRRADPREWMDPLGGTGSLVLGCATGLGSFLGLGAAGWLGFVEPGRTGDYPIATVGLVALAGLLAVLAARRFRIRWAATGAAFAAVTAWAVAAYDNEWTVRGWVDFGRTADLVATVALVPLFLCAVVAARSLAPPGRALAPPGPALASRSGRWTRRPERLARGPGRFPPGREPVVRGPEPFTPGREPVVRGSERLARGREPVIRRPERFAGRSSRFAGRPERFAAVGALLVSLGWLGLATLPYAAAWGPQLAVLLACLGAVALSRRGTVERAGISTPVAGTGGVVAATGGLVAGTGGLVAGTSGVPIAEVDPHPKI